MERRDRAAGHPAGELARLGEKHFAWQQRYGEVNEHHIWVPRDHWLEPWEQQAIVDFARTHARKAIGA